MKGRRNLTMNNDILLTIEDVADILQIDSERVRQLVLSEELPSLDYEHVSSKDLDDYIKKENYNNDENERK